MEFGIVLVVGRDHMASIHIHNFIWCYGGAYNITRC